MPKIKSSATPNPNSLKFTLDEGRFIESGMESFNSSNEAAGHPLGERLFQVAGVTNVFILPEFLTISKEPSASWNAIIGEVEAIVRDHLD